MDSRTTIPVVNIEKKFLWGENVYVVPEYTFAIELNKDTKIILSDEHEKITYNFESIYPNKKTMEKVEKSLKQEER